MTVIIKPIFPEHNFFQSTGRRFYNLFQPIQSTPEKSSDFFAYVATPFVDAVVLEPAFALDASIHLLNAVASSYRYLYLFTMNQQDLEGNYAHPMKKESAESLSHLISFVSAITAESLNTILSILALVTRPVASLIYYANTPDAEVSTMTV